MLVINMDMLQLKYFVQVAKEKSYTRAAKKLYLSQPALSKTIKKLENELGAKLFDRSGKEVKLTDCGKDLFEKAQKLIWDFNNTIESLQETKDLKRGHITIGIPPVIGTLYFSPIITNFRKMYPGISIDIFEEGAKTVADKVIEGDVDIGIVILPTNTRELIIIPVFKDENVVVVYETNPLALKEKISFKHLKNENFNIFNENFVLYDQIISKCHKSGFEPNITFKSSQWDFIIEMLSLDQGISILPRPILNRNKYSHIKTIPLEPLFPWELILIIKKGKYISYAGREFISFVQNHFLTIQ
jgi:DNA-binding transcriptional LysR family regulator